jgi:hypothetical protein
VPRFELICHAAENPEKTRLRAFECALLAGGKRIGQPSEEGGAK